MAPPKERHSEICAAVFAALLHAIPRRRLRPEGAFVIVGHCLVPNVAVLRPEQALERGWRSGAPLVAVEVASRGNTPNELDRKTELYLANGAQEVWVVYDKTESVMMHTASGPTRYRDRMFSPALGVEFDIAEWFS